MNPKDTHELNALVRHIFADSLQTEEEAKNLRELRQHNNPDVVLSEGFGGIVAFHTARLRSHRNDIAACIRRMSPALYENNGASVLSMRVDRQGNPWADDIVADRLAALAVGSKLAIYSFPRFMWKKLEGGMPYILFTIPQEERPFVPSQNSTQSQHEAVG